MPAFQAGRHGFESRLPLHPSYLPLWLPLIRSRFSCVDALPSASHVAKVRPPRGWGAYDQALDAPR